MKICLRYLGDPGYQQNIGQELGVSQATVFRTVDRVVNSIVAQSNEWIKFPTTYHELMEARRTWQSMYKFPTEICVIDCTHIGILKPNRHGDEHINRKGKPTLNVQATCDAREMFTCVDQSLDMPKGYRRYSSPGTSSESEEEVVVLRRRLKRLEKKIKCSPLDGGKNRAKQQRVEEIPSTDET
ncbi:unnamed protein product [Acanthoscelides obtectus]|uniref:Nuclease HARBI1 n=1 Tax=Acanthoscelides obtectus TaxID=200917 RepID=A0A9P0VNE5_ACAOB|nr:unnamed protein product [Acanthoscelides obtectus]CAK1648822.1 Putative nuclease HARBI1 [Acanthoscelides obtectus]